MDNNTSQSIIDGKRILKAAKATRIHPVYLAFAEGLSHIEVLQYIKIYNGRICASNKISANGKNEPLTRFGTENVIGVELLIDPSIKTIQFYSIISSVRGHGRRIVQAVVDSTPDNWFLVVPLDWSGGFWKRMVAEYPRIIIL